MPGHDWIASRHGCGSPHVTSTRQPIDTPVVLNAKHRLDDRTDGGIGVPAEKIPRLCWSSTSSLMTCQLALRKLSTMKSCSSSSNKMTARHRSFEDRVARAPTSRWTSERRRSCAIAVFIIVFSAKRLTNKLQRLQYDPSNNENLPISPVGLKWPLLSLRPRLGAVAD